MSTTNSVGIGVPGTGDLDSVMMDFGPDIDLLDDILGFDNTIDWSKLEPSLSLPLMDHAEDLGSGCGSNSSSGCGSAGPSPCHQIEEIGIPPNIMNLQPMTPESIPSPSYTPSPSTTPNPNQQQQQHQQHILKQEILTIQHHPTQTLQHKPLQTLQPVQIAPANFNFTGMVGPFNTPIFSTNTVLLPANLSLVHLEQNGKVPVKRLENPNPKEPVKKKKEASRRSSHNAIERRYRSSINDKIVELRNLVCHNSDPNDKVHKAAILKSSIDTIRYLQGANSRLDKENQDLKKLRKCPNCGNSLRDLLTTTSPATPPTSGDESAPSPPEIKPNPSSSPIALFAIATGLFLINPLSNGNGTGTDDLGFKSTSGTGHSLVKRSLNSIIHEDTYDIWWPRLVTIFINLILFIILYYFTGKIGRRSSSKIKKLSIGKYKTKTDMENIITNFASLPNKWNKGWYNSMELFKIPFKFRRSKSVDQEKYEDISKLYYEYGKVTNTLYPLLKSINYTRNDKMILANLVQAKSPRLVKYVTYFKGIEHPLGSTRDGIEFLKNNLLKVGGNETATGLITQPSDQSELSQLLCEYKEDLFTSGIEHLFNYGGGLNYLKQGLKLSRDCGKVDKRYTFWCSLMWVEIEWLHCGKRPEILDKLYQIIESNRQYGMNEPLYRAAYYTHKLKRMIYAGENISKEMIDIASSSLKDSINTSTDEKPKKAVQLIWSLLAEWILECRLELWEDTQEINGFANDLDTLRSLTHYVPTLLPSVYLYSACQRLMNGAAPSRTQQLLDATLRQYRTNPRTIRCNTAGDDCKGRGRSEVNLIREKRKGITLYLKCKYLPSQVLTCPGEKVGLLKEAVKTLEKIGETKKINNCLELIRTIGQNVTFH